MDKKLFRSLLLLITFTVGLIFVIVRFDDLWRVCANILSNFTPLFLGFAIAFVLSRYTALPLPIVYLFVNGVDLLKCIIG